MKKSEIWFGLLRIPLDFAMGVLAFVLAYQLRQHGDFIPGIEFQVDLLNFPAFNEYLEMSLWAAAGLVLIMAINRMYKLRTTSRLSNEVVKAAFLCSAWIMLIIAYYFITRQLFFSRLVLGYIWIFGIGLVCSGRILIRLIQHFLAKAGIGNRKILIIGQNILTEKIYEKLSKKPSYQIIGSLSSGKTPRKIKDLKNLGDIKDLRKIISEYGIEEIIQTDSQLSEAQASDIVDFCRENHIQYHFVPDILQIHRTQINVFHVADLPLISLKATPLDGWGKVTKRLFDIVVGSIIFILLIPFFIIISIGIKLDSRGPIIFSRKDDGSPVLRIGAQGESIHFYKFRTMKHKTDNLRYTKLAEKNHRKGTPLVKIKNDPRVTRFGRFLRRWSIDELPQLWSVLKGDLSLVGPRAHLPEEVAKYKDHHKFVLTIKPGITGLAQVNGRSDLNFEDEVRFDTYYIENWSLLLDFKILIQTIFVVLQGEGAD